MSQTKRFSFSKSATDCPVNCLLRLPLPQATEMSIGAYGAYGALSIGNRKHNPETHKNSGWGFSGVSETVMIGCYKHDGATETYSGALRRSVVSSDSSFEEESGAPPQTATETLLDITLPEYGVFDLNLVGTVGLVGDENASGLMVSYAPDAANGRVFSSEFVDTLARKMQEDSSIFDKECEGSVLFLVAAPCTDGHLRLFGVAVWEQKEAALKSKVFVVCDIPVAETMLTSVVLFPQFACESSDTNKTFRAVCASHGGEMHIITVVLAESKANSEQKYTGAAHFIREPLFVLSDDASPAYAPSYTHFSWEGHEYDSWCVSRDPLDASLAFWSGGDDGKLKRWLLSAEKWRAIDRRVDGSSADQEDEDESGEVVDLKPTLSFVKTYDAGIVTIAPMFVHSLISKSERDGNTKNGEGEGNSGGGGDGENESAPTILTTSSYLVVGSYDENLRVYHIANSISTIDIPRGQQVTTSNAEENGVVRMGVPTREPLIPQWKKLFETPLFEVACEGGAWRCRLPPPLTFLLSQLSNGRGGPQPQVDERFVIMAEHSEFTNIYEGRIFVVENENTLAGDEDECFVPLSVAAMQRGGVVVLAPLPRYHMLQSQSLTSGKDGEAVSSAVPLNVDLIDEFAIESESEHILFLEKRPPAAGEDHQVSSQKEPLIYDICPIPFSVTHSDGDRLRNEGNSAGISRILCCSFYDKEILGFTL